MEQDKYYKYPQRKPPLSWAESLVLVPMVLVLFSFDPLFEFLMVHPVVEAGFIVALCAYVYTAWRVLMW